MIVVSTFDVGGNGVLFVVTKFDTKCNEPLCFPNIRGYLAVHK